MKRANKLVLFLMMCLMLIYPGTIASANSKTVYQVSEKTMNRILGMQGGKGATALIFFHKNDNVKVSVTSSNNKVATGYVDPKHYDANGYEGYEQYICADVIPKGPGKATITIKVTTNGKTTTKSLKYHFVTYKNPFSTFKIAGKENASQFNKLKKVSLKNSVYWLFNGKIGAGKLTYKVKKGYKIISFTAWNKDNYKNRKITSNSILKKGDHVSISYQDLNTKTYGYLGFEVS
ncbi:MAG: hypothetical protein ACI4EI_00540 [Muricoprocola sp.]